MANRVMPSIPTSSTREGYDISDAPAVRVDAPSPPPAAKTSSTRSPVPLARTPTSIQRKVTEKNFNAGLEPSKGGAKKEDMAREQQFHSKEVGALVKNMRTHTTEMRAKLADTQSLYKEISAHELELQSSVGESVETTGQVASFREEMEGDFELMKLKPKWSDAVSDFLCAALGEKKDVEVSSLALYDYLATCLAKAAPESTPATAVVSYHPTEPTLLKVYHADEGAELQMGKTLRDVRGNSGSSVMPKVWQVLRTGDADLNNAHGISRDADKQSLAPLKSTKGHTFGVVVTGPPPVPDELLEMMCRQAGPLLEQVWKMEKARFAIKNVESFIKRYTIEQQVLVYTAFKEGASVKRPEHNDTWGWQPLVHNPNRPDLFELELKWKFGRPIGVFEVSCGNYTMMDANLTVLLHVMGDILTAAVEEIEDLTPGDAAPLPSVVSVLDEFMRVRPEAAKIISREGHQQLGHFNAPGVFSEIASFEAKVVDDDMRAVLTGALCLMGVRRKTLGSWEACKKQYRNVKKCHEAMLEMMHADMNSGVKAVPEKELATRWTEFNMSIKGKGGKMLLNKALYDRSPVSVQLLIRWVTVARMEHKIEDSITAEMAPPPEDKVGDAIFDAIDTDKDGALTISELTEYLLNNFPPTVAHKTLRILDTDQDKMVSRDEWRRGWADGLLKEFVQKEEAKAKEKGEEGGEKKIKKKKSTKDAKKGEK